MKKIQGRNGGTLLISEPGEKPAKMVRPKGSQNFRTIAKQYLSAMSRGEDPFDGKEKEVNNSTRLFFQLAHIAINGEKDADKIAAIREILDRMEGRVKQAGEEPTTQIENQQINIFIDGKKIDLSK